jgi:hypothetical protein
VEHAIRVEKGVDVARDHLINDGVQELSLVIIDIRLAVGGVLELLDIVSETHDDLLFQVLKRVLERFGNDKAVQVLVCWMFDDKKIGRLMK